MYYNTNDETGETLQRSRTRTATQEDIIYRIFDGEPELELAPSELLNMLGPDTVWPITSIRRALSDLTSEGKLTKTENKKLGPYGKHEFTWKLA
jgi:hypothetical protein